jgi:hypothetical protein
MDNLVDRRQFLKTTAATAGAAGTVGLSTQTDVLPGIVGESDALAVAAGVVVGTAVGAAAGVAIARYTSNTSDPDGSTNSVLVDQIYQNGISVAEGRSTFEAQLKSEYLNPATGESAYANAAWSEIRSAAAEEIVNGNGTAAAETAAQEALDRQTTIAVANMADRWNTAATALLPSLITQYEESVSTSSGPAIAPINPSASDPRYGGTTLPAGNWSFVSDSQTSDGTYMLVKTDLSLPETVGNIPELDKTPFVYAMPEKNEPNITTSPVDGHWGTDGSDVYNQPCRVTKQNTSNITKVLISSLYQDLMSTIENEYNNINGNISTYVSSLSSALNQGAISASDIYSPQDLVDQFSSSNKRSRVAAELAAAGASVPKDTSWQAKISHPDLQASELFVDLYLSFSGDPVDIRSSMTLSASQYDLAFIGYTSAATGDYVTETLSGNSDLQILDVEGISGTTDATGSVAGTVNSDGSLDLGSSPGSALTDPANADQRKNLKVTLGNGTVISVPPEDIVDDGDGTYSVPASALPTSGGETVSSAEAVPVVETQKTSDYVADPTSVDSQQVKNLLESQKQMVSEIQNLEDAATGGGAAGSVLGGGLWDWAGTDIELLEGLPGGTETGIAGAALLLYGYIS